MRSAKAVTSGGISTTTTTAATKGVFKFILGLFNTGKGKIPKGLPSLNPFEKVSPITTRILGLNPGVHTLQGTNTYLIGSGRQKILIDTGEKHTAQEYVSYLLDIVFKETTTEGLKAILITHQHHDHIGGITTLLTALQDRGQEQPPIYMRHTDSSIVAMRECGDFQALDIQDGQHFNCEGATLEAMYTPGTSC